MTSNEADCAISDLLKQHFINNHYEMAESEKHLIRDIIKELHLKSSKMPVGDWPTAYEVATAAEDTIKEMVQRTDINLSASNLKGVRLGFMECYNWIRSRKHSKENCHLKIRCRKKEEV